MGEATICGKALQYVRAWHSEDEEKLTAAGVQHTGGYVVRWGHSQRLGSELINKHVNRDRHVHLIFLLPRIFPGTVDVQ